MSNAAITDHLFHRAVLGGLPLSGTFELTPLCNFSCKMCYVRMTAEELRCSPRRQYGLQDWLRIAEEARKAGMIFVLLTGGEPTLTPWFPELYEALCDMGMLVSINTNGSMLDEKLVSLLRRKPPRRVNITLYGASNETYEALCGARGMYDRVIRAIEALCEAGIQVKLNCSLTPYNAGDLEQMTRFAGERGLILEVATYMFPPLRRDESSVGRNDRFTPLESAGYRLQAYRLQHDEQDYLGFLKHIAEGTIPPPGLEEGCIDPVDGQVRCRAGRASFWITWDGKMLPCGMMTEPVVETVGRPFGTAWQELIAAAAEIRLSGVCSECRNSQLCHACAAMAQTETGSFSGIPKYLCEMVQEMKSLAEQELSRMEALQSK